MNRLSSFRVLATLAAVAALSTSCSDLTDNSSNGYIEIVFADGGLSTRSTLQYPDPGSFHLTVTDSHGNEVYSGTYGESPEKIEVKAGSYTVSAVSCDFDGPVFDTPQWGDTRVVAVQSGQTVGVDLCCVQQNCGMKLLPDATFRTAYPSGVLYLKGTGGTLMYGYTEKRTAYFRPGTVSVVLSDSGVQETLCTRELRAQEILQLGLSANLSASGSGIRLDVDTSRVWTVDSFVSGGTGGSCDACTVTQARDHVGEKSVWVRGYVVGVATGTGKFSFDAPFGKNTNVVLGLRSSSTEKEYLLSVELPKGDIRDALNLQDNPGLQGRQVSVCGEIVDAYYGITGLKSPVAYETD